MDTRYSRTGLFFIMCLGVLVLSRTAEAQNTVIITHKGVDVVSLKKEEIKQIFLGKKTRWEDGTPITLALFAEKNSYASFLKEYVKRTTFQYTNFWKKQIFTGKGRMPKTFNNEHALCDFIASTEGAISYMNVQDVDSERVNVLEIAN